MRGVLFAFGWVATVAAAFVLGKTMGGSSPGGGTEEVVRAVDDSADRDRDPGPMLAPGASGEVGSGAASARGRAGRTNPDPDDPFALRPGETLEPFTLEGVTDPGEAMSRIMRHVSALLAKGEAGHLELLNFLDENIVRNKDLERLFEGSEAQMARHIVPMIEFLVHRKGQVVGVIETVFETMAERPQLLAEVDDDTLEIFTEGAAVILPGAVPEAELAKYRGWVNKLLETPKGSLPEPVEKQRRRLTQALMFWAPSLSPEDALARLRSGELRGAEAVQVLRRLPADQLAGIDLVAVLTPVVAELDYRTLRALRDIPLQPRDVDALDRAALDAAAAGKAHDWTMGQYLHATQRSTWPEQQVFLEEGFRRGGAVLEVCAQTLTRIGGQVPKEYFQWVLETYDLSEGTAKRLQAYVDRK